MSLLHFSSYLLTIDTLPLFSSLTLLTQNNKFLDTSSTSSSIQGGHHLDLEDLSKLIFFSPIQHKTSTSDSFLWSYLLGSSFHYLFTFHLNSHRKKTLPFSHLHFRLFFLLRQRIFWTFANFLTHHQSQTHWL